MAARPRDMPALIQGEMGTDAAQIKALSKGDIVGIKFVTDGERHRIVQLEKKPAK